MSAAAGHLGALVTAVTWQFVFHFIPYYVHVSVLMPKLEMKDGASTALIHGQLATCFWLCHNQQEHPLLPQFSKAT